MKLNMKLIGSIILSTFMCSSVYAQSESSLQKMESDEFDQVLVASTVKLASTKLAYVKNVPVTFSKDWLLQFESKTSTSYRDHIKESYGATLKLEIEKSLREQGWTISEKPAETSIVISPEIKELNLAAPELIGVQQTILARNAGDAQVHITYSSAKGDVFMSIVDHGSTPAAVGSPFANRPTNFRYFKLLLSNWAQVSSVYLDSILEEVGKAKQAG